MAFWNPKPAEELYDLQSDPDEVRNLANSPEHQEIKSKLRAAQQKLAAEIRDLGFLPEGERFARSHGDSPYDMARDGNRYPFDKIFAAAEVAAMRSPEATPALLKMLEDTDNGVRYWGVLGLQIRGREPVREARQALRKCFEDSSPDVAIAAAEALGTFGDADDQQAALDLLLKRANWSQNEVFVAMSALNSLDALGDGAAKLGPAIEQLPTKGDAPNPRYAAYVPRLLKDLLAKLDHVQ